MPAGSPIGLQQIITQQGIKWGDGAGHDYHLWIDGNILYTDCTFSTLLSGIIIPSGTPTVAGQLGYGSGHLNIGDGASNHVLVDLDSAQSITGTKTLTQPILTAATPTAAGQVGYGSGHVNVGDGSANHVLVDLDSTQIITGLKTIQSSILSSPTLRSPLFQIELFALSGTVATNTVVAQADSSGGAVTVTLPAATGTGRWIIVQKVDSSGTAVTIGRTGSDTINGATSVSLAAQYNSRTVYDGASAKWYVIAST